MNLIRPFFLLLIPALSFAQPYRSFRMVESEPLSAAGLLHVHTDRSGMPWLLTTQGFMSYDGTEVRAYTDTIKGSFTNPIVSFPPAVCEDVEGNLYVWKYQAGLVRFDPRSGNYSLAVINAKDTTTFSNMAISGIFADNAGDLWLAGRSGLIRYNPRSGLTRNYSLSDQDVEFLTREGHDRQKSNVIFENTKKYFTGITQDIYDENKLWISGGATIWHFDKRSGKFQPAVMPDAGNPTRYGYVIMDMLDVSRDTLVFATIGGGLGFYSKRKRQFDFLLRDSSTYRSLGIRTNKNIALRLFRVKENGFYVNYRDDFSAYYDMVSRKQTFLTRDSLLKGYRMYVDDNDRVWLFTRNRLYHAINPAVSFGKIDVSHQERPNVSGNLLSSVYWDHTSRKYYAGINFSDGVHIWEDDLTNSAIYPSITRAPELSNLEPPTWDIVNAGSISWSIGFGHSLMVLDNKAYHHYSTVKGFDSLRFEYTPPEREALDLYKRSEDELFVLSGKGNVYRIDTRNRSMHLLASFKDSSASSGWGLGKILRGPGNGVIFVTDHKTIYRYDLVTGKARSFLHETKTPGLQLTLQDIATDTTGNIWVATADNEILCFSGQDFSLIDRLPGKLNFNQSLNIAVSAGNHLLVSESGALLVYDIASKKLFRHNEKSGMLPAVFNKVLTENGMVFLAYVDQVLYASLSALTHSPAGPVAYVSAFSIYGKPFDTDSLLRWQRTIRLNHRQNFISFRFSASEFDRPDQVRYQYKFPSLDTNWIEADMTNRGVSFANLKPRSYDFCVRASLPNGDNGPIATYRIVIQPAWWQTGLFKILAVILGLGLIASLVIWRFRVLHRREILRSKQEKEILELEAKALRAQMNPHFIFNCLNSIKSLVQQGEVEKSITYLTTFSKLIRTLFNNADKKEISLFDEIETCRLYLQLESMRFDAKFSYDIQINPSVDLKSVLVPALIIQPFIENAIWHGIVPRETGGQVILSVTKAEKGISIIIDDDGIGRTAATSNRSVSGLTHQSKGINLTQSRLRLDNLIQHRQATLEVVDKKDREGQAKGTCVTITIKEEV